MADYSIKQLRRDSEKDHNLWKKFLTNAIGTTIFHNPDFLAYHANRFNEHHLGIFSGEALMGILPMALSEEGGKIIAKSPYGASYGGFIFNSVLSYGSAKKIVTVFKEHLKANSVDKVVLTPSLPIYHSVHSDTFLFALLEQGFKTVNSDITSVVSLHDGNLEEEVFTSRARNMYRKAKKSGISAIFRSSNLNHFWLLMEKTFTKHNAKPTHTFEQWKWLSEKLPGEVWCDIAYSNEKPVAGIGHFRINALADSSFYLCSDPEFTDTQCLSMLVYDAILQAKREGFTYFDFGTSSVNMVGRENIFQFKESFGATGVFRHTYALEL